MGLFFIAETRALWYYSLERRLVMNLGRGLNGLPKLNRRNCLRPVHQEMWAGGVSGQRQP